MNSQTRRMLVALLLVELVVGLGAIGWRLSSPAAPVANLSRLPVSTAADIQQLQQRVRGDRLKAWLELGEAYLGYGYFPQAEACLRHATKLDPQSFPAVYAHAYSLDRLCRLPESEARFRTAAALTKDEPASNCWYHIGLIHLKQEDAKQAEQAFQRAGDGYPPAVHARARLRIRSGQSTAGLALIETLRRPQELDIQTEMLAVQAFRELKNPIEMARAAERAERSQPRLRLSDHWEYLHPIRARYGLMSAYSLAQALAEQMKVGDAARVFQGMFVEESLEHTIGMFEQGVYLCLLAGQPEVASGILDRFEQRISLPPSARHLRADALAALGRLEEAVALWESTNQLLPDDQSYRSLSAAHTQLGKTDEANRDLGLAALFSGIGAYQGNQLDSALKDLQQAQNVLKDDARPSFYLGEMYLGLSQIDKARAEYLRCLELDPDHGRALERLARFTK